MCIIIAKAKGAKPLPTKVFENVWDNNPDGAGILYNDGICTTLSKGIMKRENFLKKVKEANRTECSFIIHTRIATHGSVKPENTHPFVSKSLGFAHNGTMPITPDDDKTDSETFFLNTIADKNMEWCIKNKYLLNLATKNSRCAIFDMNTGDILLLNEQDWVEDKDYPGVKFSCKSYSYSYPKLDYSKGYSSYGRYGSCGYDFDDFDDYDEYGISKYQEKVNKKIKNKKSYDEFKNSTMKGIKFGKNGAYLDYNLLTDKYLPSRQTDPTTDEARDFKAALKVWDELYNDAMLYYDDDVAYEQALKVIKLFYGIAYANGYHNMQEVDSIFSKFLDEQGPSTEMEFELLNEIRYQAGLDVKKESKKDKDNK
jgi:hypothetical protein